MNFPKFNSNTEFMECDWSENDLVVNSEIVDQMSENRTVCPFYGLSYMAPLGHQPGKLILRTKSIRDPKEGMWVSH